MRIGVGLLVVLVVGLALSAMLRPTSEPAPRLSADAAASQPEGPSLRGQRSADSKGRAEGITPPPTEDEIRKQIATILAGKVGWEALLRWLDDARIEFGPHLGAILAACRADDKGLRSRASQVLSVAFDDDRIAARREDFRIDGLDPEGAHPLGPEHRADVASLLRAEVHVPLRWPEWQILCHLTRLGPRAHEVVPDAIAWYWRARHAFERAGGGYNRGGGLVERLFLGSRSVIGQLGPSALPHLEVIAADEPDDDEFDLLFYAVDFMHEAATPTLVAWLDDDNPSLRRSAARVIARSSEQRWSEELRTALEARLRDPDEEVRNDVAAALATLLPGTADVIGRILAGEDHAARAGALTGLSTSLNQTPPELRAQLLEIMRTPDYRIGEPILDVAMALSNRADRPNLEARATGLLHAMVAAGGFYDAYGVDEEDDRRERLWRGMGPEAWPHLWKALHSEDPGLPLAAAWAMAWNGAPDAAHRGLLGHWLLSHPTSELRVPVAAALGDPANTAVVEVLLAALRSSDYIAASIAALGLQRFGTDITRHLALLAKAVESVHQIRFCYGKPTRSIERLDATLGMAAQADLDAAIELIDHGSASVRAVVHAAFAVDAAQGLAVLRRHWRTASSSRRVGILEALLAFEFGFAVDLDQQPRRAWALACFTAKDRALRVAAARVIYHYRDPESLIEEAAAVLASTVLNADGDEGAAGAIATLAREARRGRHVVAVRALQKYVDHENEDVRRRAGWWIDKIKNPR